MADNKPAADAPKKAEPQPTDVVFRFTGKRGTPPAYATATAPAQPGTSGDLVTTEFGALPQRDLTRADMPVYVRTRAWFQAIAESGTYAPVEGVTVHFADPARPTAE